MNANRHDSADTPVSSERFPTSVRRSSARDSVGRVGLLLTGLSFLFSLFLVFYRIGDLPLLDPDEGRNAQVSREMMESREWLIPSYNQVPYLDKPAFFFDLVSVSYRVFGVSARAARVPSALFAIALLVLVYWFCRREYGLGVANLAVVTVSAMPLFFAFSRLVIFDMSLAFFVAASILFGYRALSDGSSATRWFLWAWAAAGAATLVKGPVGLVLPLLVLAVFAITDRGWRNLGGLFHVRNLALFLALVLPWFFGVTWVHSDFPYYGLVKESVERISTPEFQRGGPIYYYGPVVLGVCYAWSLLLPEAAVVALRRWRTLARSDRLLVIWAVVVVVFFSLSQSKLPGYILTAVIAFGVLCARLFDRAFRRPSGRAGRIVRRGAWILLVTSLTAAAWMLVETHTSGALSSHFGIQGRDYVRARWLFPSMSLTLSAIGILALVGFFLRRTWFLVGSFLILPVALLTVGFDGLRGFARNASAVELGQAVTERAAEADVVLVGSYVPGLAFYLEKTPYLATADGHETTSNYIPFFLSRAEEWPRHMIHWSQLGRWIEKHEGPLLLLVRKHHRAVVDSLSAATSEGLGQAPAGWYYVYLPHTGSQ